MIQALLKKDHAAHAALFEREREIALLTQALEMLDEQRAVAIRANMPADHMAELDEEETAYRARLDEIGGMITQ